MILDYTNVPHLKLGIDSPFELINARAGNMLVLREDSTVSENIRNLGHWAWDHVEIFKSLLGPKGTFVDVGAYIGHHSVAILNHLNSSGFVVAIEGQPQISQVCAYSLSIQGYANWKVISALVDKAERDFRIPYLDFEKANNFGSLSLISPQKEFGESSIKVVSSTLDFLLEDIGNIQLMKFDVQFSELMALQGGYKILNQHLPHLFLEISPRNMYTRGGYDYRSIYHLLLGLGYRLFDVLGFPISQGRNSHPLAYIEDLEWDIIAIHESKLEVLRSIPWVI